MEEILFTSYCANRTAYTVHHNHYAGNSFNPNTSSSGRFHPFVDSAGKIVPTLYASDTPNGALFETLFRKPEDDEFCQMPISVSNFVDRSISFWCPTIDLTLADFTHVTDEYSEIRNALVGSAAYYSKARVLAKIIHDQTDAHGITWNGRQIDMVGLTNMVLFGDRVFPAQLKILKTLPLQRGDGYRFLKLAATAAKRTLPEKG